MVYHYNINYTDDQHSILDPAVHAASFISCSNRQPPMLVTSSSKHHNDSNIIAHGTASKKWPCMAGRIEARAEWISTAGKEVGGTFTSTLMNSLKALAPDQPLIDRCLRRILPYPLGPLSLQNRYATCTQPLENCFFKRFFQIAIAANTRFYRVSGFPPYRSVRICRNLSRSVVDSDLTDSDGKVQIRLSVHDR